MSELDKIKQRIARRESLRKEEPQKPSIDFDFNRIQRLDAFGQDITLQPRQPDIDFTSTVETFQLPGKTMRKGVQQIFTCTDNISFYSFISIA